MQIYLARNQVQAGPYTLEEVNNMLQTREVDLNDLMWHEGMKEWQRVGNLTAETYQYAPNGVSDTPISVNDLYGRSSISPTVEPKKTNISKIATARDQFNLNKTSDLTHGVNKLASVSSRVLAVFIDNIIGLLCFVPLFSIIDMDTIESAEAVTWPFLVNAFSEAVPLNVGLSMMTLVFFAAYLLVQVVMLIRRGQTMGKLVTGVRILDMNTQRVPPVTNLLLIRTILPSIAYNLPVIGIGIMVADFVSMVIDKLNRSLHDRVAKTIVVKADDRQLKHIKDIKKKAKTLKKK